MIQFCNGSVNVPTVPRSQSCREQSQSDTRRVPVVSFANLRGAKFRHCRAGRESASCEAACRYQYSGGWRPHAGPSAAALAARQFLQLFETMDMPALCIDDQPPRAFPATEGARNGFNTRVYYFAYLL